MTPANAHHGLIRLPLIPPHHAAFMANTLDGIIHQYRLKVGNGIDVTKAAALVGLMEGD